MHNEPECPVPLITDDGQFLILLHLGPALSEDAVLQIYRWDHRYEPAIGRTGHHGVLIKGIDPKKSGRLTKLPQIRGPGTTTRRNGLPVERSSSHQTAEN